MSTRTTTPSRLQGPREGQGRRREGPGAGHRSRGVRRGRRPAGGAGLSVEKAKAARAKRPVDRQGHVTVRDGERLIEDRKALGHVFRVIGSVRSSVMALVCRRARLRTARRVRGIDTEPTDRAGPHLVTIVVRITCGTTGHHADPGHGLDLAHRGGMGLTTEEQPAAYRKALALGVSTPELDTQVTADKKVAASHDRVIDGTKCRDTGSNHFVGRATSPWTLAQVQTLDCGFQQYPGFEEQEVATGARLAELRDIVAVARGRRPRRVVRHRDQVRPGEGGGVGRARGVRPSRRRRDQRAGDRGPGR